MKTNRAAFTLFELILAIALAAVLLSLIGMAINLYLMRVDTDRTRVEEAQLARSVLAMITDDIRAATVYQAQDTTAVAQLMAAGTPFDVDSIDKARETSSSTGGPGGTSGVTKVAAQSSGSAASGASSSSSASTSSGSTNEESDDTLPLGISGTAGELYVDVTRLPKQEELFATVTGYTNAPSPASSNAGASGTTTTNDANPPADLKTVHYSVRQGEAIEPGSAAATSLAPDAQAHAGGLVRQEIPRRMRVFAEESGDSGLLESGQTLVAPEVVGLEFKYYDGSEATDVWDMKETKTLPIAIEVCVWLRSSRVASAGATSSAADMATSARAYRQTVYLPMSQISASNAESGAEVSADSTTPETSSSSSDSSSSSGSAFGEE